MQIYIRKVVRQVYIERTLQPVLMQAAEEFPAVVLTGPRQSGKTTLLKHLFRDCRYVSLEPPDVRAAATIDPRGFLELNAPPVILDEVQYAPDLLPYIKEEIDADRGSKGQYLLTGSQNLLMHQGVTESLAGRSAVLRLLPLSFHELTGNPQGQLPWDNERVTDSAHVSYLDSWRQFLRGGYPELAAEPQRDSSLWYSSYAQTYIERDVRGLRQIGDLTQFQSFLRVLAARSGQLLNLSDISRDLGISLNTAKQWLSILEATFQVVILRPYYENVGKRLVKTPKVFFTDTGLLCHLAGLRDPEHAASGPMGGAIFETAVHSEIIKHAVHTGQDPHIYFWRTSNGVEVDILIEHEGKLIPIEVKETATPRPALASGLAAFLREHATKSDRGWLVHLGEARLPLAPGITAVPFSQL